jgi:hypothetical protein
MRMYQQNGTARSSDGTESDSHRIATSFVVRVSVLSQIMWRFTISTCPVSALPLALISCTPPA